MLYACHKSLPINHSDPQTNKAVHSHSPVTVRHPPAGNICSTQYTRCTTRIITVPFDSYTNLGQQQLFADPPEVVIEQPVEERVPEAVAKG